MKEKPIIFNSEMVRAILDGRKTQTRRVVKNGYPNGYTYGGVNKFDEHIFYAKNELNDCLLRKCPYGVPGDRLWVREKFSTDPSEADVTYLADGEVKRFLTDWVNTDDDGFFYRHKSPKTFTSIHMPREFSRILLEIVSVRVERVQDIGTDDVFREGICDPLCQSTRILPDGETCPQCGWTRGASGIDGGSWVHWPRKDFENLWNSINEKAGFGWDMNPWVWIVEFKVLDESKNKA